MRRSPAATEGARPLYSMSCGRDRRYDVHFGCGALATGPLFPQVLSGRKALLVTTPTVGSLHGPEVLALGRAHDVDLDLLTLACREETKTMRAVEEVCRRSVDIGLGRTDVLVAMGGGVCLDIVTVAASMLRRGIAHVRIPTTLVAQVDAGVGLKGAVNFGGKKNFLGAFWPPDTVVVDPELLRTLPDRHLREGLAEIIKIAVVRDPALFALVVDHHRALVRSAFQRPAVARDGVIRLAAQRMLEELASNPYEDRSYQRLVDFGHTFSPALEAAAHFTLSHGDAVAIDIALSSTLATELGVLSDADSNRIVAALRATQLPTSSPLLTPELCAEALRQAAAHRGGKANLVLPTAIGAAVFLEDPGDVPSAAIEAALARLAGGSRRPIPDGRRAWATPNGATRARDAWLVFDVGGTHMRAGIYDPSRDALTASTRGPSPSLGGASAVNGGGDVLAAMRRLGLELLPGREPDRVSTAFAGPIDRDGNLLAAPTLGYGQDGHGISLVRSLRATWPTARVTVLNDVTAAGYRYVAPDCLDFCIVTVSSGIGNKVFASGRPLVGPRGEGGEIGHVRVDDSAGAPRCDCGATGHLGAISSGRGTLAAAIRLARREPGPFLRSRVGRETGGDPSAIGNEALVAAFHAGDDWACGVVQRAARPLSRILATAHALAGIERFIVVGGFALALGAAYRMELVQGAAASCWRLGQDWSAMITLGEPDDLAGLIGAGRFAVEQAEAVAA